MTDKPQNDPTPETALTGEREPVKPPRTPSVVDVLTIQAQWDQWLISLSRNVLGYPEYDEYTNPKKFSIY